KKLKRTWGDIFFKKKIFIPQIFKKNFHTLLKKKKLGVFWFIKNWREAGWGRVEGIMEISGGAR
ncbi:hypothetical protein, partial [Staphylococcus aureus]|uniref:hypothetical protein n=1 Tax=Staphylococcus aureus TaxID=1280 RepID=UPI000F16B477